MIQLINILNQCPQLDLLSLNENHIHSIHLPESSFPSLSSLSLQGILSNYSYSLELQNLTELCIDNNSLQSITHFQISSLPQLQSIIIHSYCLSSFQLEDVLKSILSISMINQIIFMIGQDNINIKRNDFKLVVRYLLSYSII